MFCVIIALSFFIELFNAEFHHVGDMILDDNQFYKLTGIKSQSDSEGFQDSGIRGEEYRWPNGQLPYEFSSELNPAVRKKIQNAIAHFNSKFDGCIKIRPKTIHDSNYVKVIKGKGCYSSVGKILSLGEQALSIGNNCDTRGTILHEFMHAFGFHHEQNRPDRDDYVTINWSNIKNSDPPKEHNFEKSEYSIIYTPYNGRSLMHYHATAFSKDDKFPFPPTITSKIRDIPTSELGRANDLTSSDIINLKSMYKCTSPNPSPVTSPRPSPRPSPVEPRGNVCDRPCKSDDECSGSDTCNRCCWWIGYGSVCSAPLLGVGCIQSN
jgi:hypothetical protein